MANLVLDTSNTEINGTTLTTRSRLPAFNVDNPQGIALTVTSAVGNAMMVTAPGGPNLGSVLVDSQSDAIHVVTRSGGTGVTVDASAGRVSDGFAGGTGVKVITRRGGTGVDVSADGTGVLVNTPQDNGIIVNAGGSGVFAISSTSAGVFGVSNRAMGVLGIGSSWGGVFWGGLLCASGPKNAAVRHPDGAHRLMHSLECPESWFEDFGRAKLVRGKARVEIDPTFVVFVRGDYHVFLAPEGECRGMYVARRTRAGFVVREQGGGRSNVEFSYRIVARRKDVTSPRFQKVKLEAPKELMREMPKPGPTPGAPERGTLRAARKGARRQS